MTTDRPDDRADEQIVIRRVADAMHEEGAFGLTDYEIARLLYRRGLLSTPADQDDEADSKVRYYRAAWESMRGSLGHETDLRKRAEAERDLLRAQVAAVRALADEWEQLQFNGNSSESEHTRGVREQIRECLNELRAKLDTAGGGGDE